MAVFIVRRLIVSFFVLLVSTFLVYVLVVNSGDPLEDLRQDQSPNRDAKIATRRQRLQLDVPVPERYLGWLSGVARCVIPGADCDLGLNRDGQDVTTLIGQASSATLRLVLVATVLAVVIGVLVGILSALRQYSGFDYAITFTAFLFFSLPVFWVAVLLKQYGAIALNDWLAEPRIPLPVIVVLSLLAGLTWQALLGGDRRRRLLVAAVAAVATGALLAYLSAVEWFRQPALGPVVLPLLVVGTALAMTALFAGLGRRPVLLATLATAVAVVVAYFALRGTVLPFATWATLLILAVGGVLVGVAAGFAFGGLDKGLAARAAGVTGFLGVLAIFLDMALNAVPDYSRKVGGRLIATIGSNTPNFSGTFWEGVLDAATHLVLPTAALMLISFATYSRYTRASMLEVLNQDYVRTARAKGLTERTVVVRHAFRNALIPVTTLAAVDFGAVIGGAVITETVFGWQGMGALFREGLLLVDPNPVMGFYIVAAASIVVFNMLADIAYAYLDPRIRLG